MILGNLKPGDQRIITANAPASGYSFTGWTGDTAHLADPLAMETIVTMPSQNVTVTASYSEIVYTNINYGYLYNWYAATDSRKITSSDDWVLPTRAQWETLAASVGGASTASPPLRETGTDHWVTPNSNATNSSGFTARGGDHRGNAGIFDVALFKAQALFWANNLYGTVAQRISLSTGLNSMGFGSNPLDNGCSLRLLYTGAGSPTTYTGNDGKIYPVVLIGTQRWISCNLNETKYRNSDWITGFDGGVYTTISNEAWAALTTEAMCYYNDDVNNG